jgi:polyisoprenoid-binding protein YceI
MYNRLMRLGFIVTAVVVFAAGCAPSQAALPAATTVSSPAAAPTAVSPAPTAASAVSPLATPPTASGSLTSNAIRFALVPEKSEARFRVREQLANASLPNDAIGRTHEFTGTIVVKPDGTIVSSDSKFVVNLGTLTSDRSQRDNYIKRNVLQTNQYPNAVFVPTQVTGLSSPLPQSGAVSFKLIGDFTIQNVTKPVTWDVTGQVQGNEFTGQATTSFKFEDFGLTQPRVAVVLSVEDHIQLELDLDLQRMN